MCAWPIAMFLRARRRARPRVACLRGGAISEHLPWHVCAPAAKRPRRKDAGSVRSRRPCSQGGRHRRARRGALQRPGACAGRGRGSQTSGLGRRPLAAADGLLRALAGARVGLRALAVDRQAAAVADTAVRADLLQALDRLRALPAQVALDLEVRVDVLARSEEHTSELQSHHDLVCRLLLEKKNKQPCMTQRSVKNKTTQIT